MFKYEKPVAEIINLLPVEKMMHGFEDDASNWGDDEDWGEEGWD